MFFLPKALKKKKPKKMPRLPEPRGVTRGYQTGIRKIVKQVQNSLEVFFIPELKRILEDVESQRPNLDRLDSEISDRMAALLKKTRAYINERVTDTQINKMVSENAAAINSFSRANIINMYRKVFGVDIFISEPWIATEMGNFVNANVSLIKNVNESFLKSVENTVNEGMRRGLRHEQISKQVLSTGQGDKNFVSKSPFKTAETRANLIGRDQTNKFNGQLNELRQTSLGVKKYIWRTVQRENVRPEHAEREGKVFSWSNPPEDGHPGEPINCRCYAEPILDEFFTSD